MTTKETLLQLFLSYVLPLLLTGLGAVAIWAVGKLATWLHSKEQTSKLARLGSFVADYAASIVAELNATLRPQLASALADGVLTDAEKAQLKATALDALKNRLPPSIKALVDSLYGPAAETLLAGAIERAVLTQKAALPSSVPLLLPLSLPKAAP